MISKLYLTYITTNIRKTVLYTGFTNNLAARLCEHYRDRKAKTTFAGKYNCFYLVYYDVFFAPGQGIGREKEIKGWSREKKETLINKYNPEWRFLNDEFLDWPPTDDVDYRRLRHW